jgi:hypothetical protein
VRLGRDFDVQLILMGVFGGLIPFLAILVPGSAWVKLLSFFVLLVIFWSLDATTVNLKVAVPRSNESKV